jgi:histidinol-phosphate aminotransferase
VPPKIRPGLIGLTPHEPRPDPADLSRQSGGIRLFANESPYAPIPSVAKAIADAALEINGYPRPAARTALCLAIAERFDLDYRQVSLGGGSIALIHGLVRLVAERGDEGLQSWPTYRGFGDAVVAAGASLVSVDLRQHQHDLAGLLGAITDRTRVIYICNPNNPTGSAVRRRELRDFLERVPDEVLVIIDEVYIDFVDDPEVSSSIELAVMRDNVAVVRSLSKVYGLAGLRVGFSVTSPEVAEVLNRVLVPFSVSSIALAAATASFGPEAAREVSDRLARTISERRRVAEELMRLAYEVVPSSTNFLYLPMKAPSSLVARAAAQGVEILEYPSAARVTIGAPAENDAFLAIAAEYAGVMAGGGQAGIS